eukprot:318736-Amorphochlora_amoeboformis.AAC.1
MHVPTKCRTLSPLHKDGKYDEEENRGPKFALTRENHQRRSLTACQEDMAVFASIHTESTQG